MRSQGKNTITRGETVKPDVDHVDMAGAAGADNPRSAGSYAFLHILLLVAVSQLNLTATQPASGNTRLPALLTSRTIVPDALQLSFGGVII